MGALSFRNSRHFESSRDARNELDIEARKVIWVKSLVRLLAVIVFPYAIPFFAPTAEVFIG